MALPSGQLLSVVFGVSELVLQLARRSKGSGPSLDRRSLRLLLLIIATCVTAGAFIPRLWPALRPGISPWLPRVGLLFFASGLLLRWVAIVWLGRFFTVDVAIAKDHRLVQTGPYKLARHPSYSGLLIALLGLGISFENWLSLLLVTVPPFLILRYRMQVEEDALQSAFGAAYHNYARTTKRLVPFLY